MKIRGKRGRRIHKECKERKEEIPYTTKNKGRKYFKPDH